MLLIGFLALFLLLVVYLLLVPINLVINTNTNEYYLQLKGLMKASIKPDEKKLIKIKLKIFFLTYYYYPLMYKVTNKKKKLEGEQKKKGKMKVRFKTILKLLKSFKVKKLLVEIDTGDCILNAKLYPVFGFLNYSTGNFIINFEGRNQMVFLLQNRPLNIIKSFINN
tara:strand:- start:10141 stop:10641 length:501 start_codon:yes stop_codon:yes gene_type:complete